MEFCEIVANFAKRHGVEGLAAEEESAPAFGSGGFMHV